MSRYKVKMPFRYSHLFPLIIGVWFPVTFVITYVIAVSRKDVQPFFSYISDTGTWSPESCVFGFLLNMGSFLMIITVYIRYRLVKYLSEQNSFNSFVGKWNKTCLSLGLIAVLGVIIVAHFQETNALVVHVLGAFMCFGMGCFYQLIQARISWLIYPSIGNKKVNIAKFIFCGITTLSFVVTSAAAGPALLVFRGDDISNWKKDDGGYILHAVSAVSEWIMCISAMIHFMLYTVDFKNVIVYEPAISLDGK